MGCMNRTFHLSPGQLSQHFYVLSVFYFIFILTVCVCICVCMQSLWSAEAVIRSSGAGVTGCHEPWAWVLRTQLSSSGRAVHTHNCRAILPDPRTLLFYKDFLASRKARPVKVTPGGHCLLWVLYGHIFLA